MSAPVTANTATVSAPAAHAHHGMTASKMLDSDTTGHGECEHGERDQHPFLPGHRVNVCTAPVTRA